MTSTWTPTGSLIDVTLPPSRGRWDFARCYPPAATGDIVHGAGTVGQLRGGAHTRMSCGEAASGQPEREALLLWVVPFVTWGEFEEAADLPPACGRGSSRQRRGQLLARLDTGQHPGQEGHREEARAALERAVNIRPRPAYRIELATSCGASAMRAHPTCTPRPLPRSTPTPLRSGGARLHRLVQVWAKRVRRGRQPYTVSPLRDSRLEQSTPQFDLALVRLCQGRGELAADEYRHGLDQLQRLTRACANVDCSGWR